MYVIWWAYLKGDVPAGVICLLINLSIIWKSGLSLKGWDCLYPEFHGMSCKIDDSRISLLFCRDGSYASYNKNHYFIIRLRFFFKLLAISKFLIKYDYFTMNSVVSYKNDYYQIYEISIRQKSDIWEFITNRGSFCYYKLRQQLLPIGATHFITNRGKIIKNRVKYYKLGFDLLQIGPGITIGTKQLKKSYQNA